MSSFSQMGLFHTFIQAQTLAHFFMYVTRNTHAQSMPRAEEIYPEICK